MGFAPDGDSSQAFVPPSGSEYPLVGVATFDRTHAASLNVLLKVRRLFGHHVYFPVLSNSMPKEGRENVSTLLRAVVLRKFNTRTGEGLKPPKDIPDPRLKPPPTERPGVGVSLFPIDNPGIRLDRLNFAGMLTSQSPC